MAESLLVGRNFVSGIWKMKLKKKPLKTKNIKNGKNLFTCPGLIPSVEEPECCCTKPDPHFDSIAVNSVSLALTDSD